MKEFNKYLEMTKGDKTKYLFYLGYDSDGFESPRLGKIKDEESDRFNLTNKNSIIHCFDTFVPKSAPHRIVIGHENIIKFLKLFNGVSEKYEKITINKNKIQEEQRKIINMSDDSFS